MTITGILLIPHDGDPHKLLGDPESVAWRCGARPPVVAAPRRKPTHPCQARCWRVGGAVTIFGPGECCPECGAPWPKDHALVLAMDGELLASGVLCFAMAIEQRLLGAVEDVETVVRDLLDGDLDALADTYGKGTFVLIDADGRECDTLPETESP